MGRFVFVCLILAEILIIQTMAVRSDGSVLKYPPDLITTTVRSGVESHPVESSVADPPLSSEGGEESEVAEAPEIRRLGKHHADKSVAGGGVIIGGLVTAIFAAVYCYIRVTRKKNSVDDQH